MGGFSDAVESLIFDLILIYAGWLRNKFPASYLRALLFFYLFLVLYITQEAAAFLTGTGIWLFFLCQSQELREVNHWYMLSTFIQPQSLGAQ